MQTAFNITNVTFSATFDPEPPENALLVNFQIFNKGPNHVAGIIVTTNDWVTSQVAPARFVSFSDGGENWSVSFSGGTPGSTFEFVIFCDDFGGVDFVPRIWNTNGGSVFQAVPKNP